MGHTNDKTDLDQQDAGFLSLPAHLRSRIDRAFDKVAGQSHEHEADADDSPSRIHRSPKTFGRGYESNGAPLVLRSGFISDDPQPGGFIVNEPQPGGFIVDEPQAGCFIVDDTHAKEPISNTQDKAHRPSRLSLSLIPSALQLLDLQPDDEDVLAVFRNAASGWEDSSNRRFRNDSADQDFVSRSDWRAVCAALLDTGDAAQQSDGTVSIDHDKPANVGQEDGIDDESEDSHSEDAYVASEDGDVDLTPLSEDSGDDYVEGGFILQAKSKRSSRTKGKGAKTRRSERAKDDTDSPMDNYDLSTPKPLSARQKEVCRSAFRLFFPEVPEENLDRQKIMIKDISRVAQLLKEKITTDEVSDLVDIMSKILADRW